MYLELDNKLYDLQRACNRHPDPLANWVLYAVSRHIATGRATRDFERAFIAYPESGFPDMIGKALNGDRSDNAIIKKVVRIVKGGA